MLSPLLVGPILREKCLDAQCISNTTRVCLEAFERHFFLLSSTGFTPHKLFHGGRPAWFFKTPFPEDFKSPVGDWLEHKQSLANQAGTNLRHVRDRELSRRNRLRRPASFKVGDLVLVHHSRLPSWRRNCLQDPYFGPYRIIRIDGSRIHVRCSPRLGGELLCAPKQLRHYHSPDNLS